LFRLLGHSAVIKRGHLTFRLEESTVYSSYGPGLGVGWHAVVVDPRVRLRERFNFSLINDLPMIPSRDLMPHTHRHLRLASRPKIDLLDPKGIIRYKNVRGQALDEALEHLVAEMASVGKS
jgi:hypothetical protein